MKKYLLLIIPLFISCSKKDFYNEKQYFVMEKDSAKIYTTFINDTVLVINHSNFKDCGWNFINFNKSKNGLYTTNDLKTDTVWLKSNNDGFVMSSEEGVFNFNPYEVSKDSVEILKKRIEIAQGFFDKKISFICEYSFKQISKFYDLTISEVKFNLKNPESLNVLDIYISDYSTFNDKDKYSKTDIAKVRVSFEAKNGLGNVTEGSYYVFFIPKETNKNQFDIVLSESIILSSEKIKSSNFINYE